MCKAIYILLKNELSKVKWNDDSPNFHVIKVEHQGTLETLGLFLDFNYVYEALSFMGCSCGLSYSEL